ncbi:MAG: SPOR domain-containing protein [Gammaproteobacteria bacterium WSBS_2016_MAG_OTU1]
MNAKSTVPTSPDPSKETEAWEEQQERRVYRQRVRRRLLGAGAMVLLVVFVWRLGGVSNPPDIEPAPPPDDVPIADSSFGLNDIREKLQEIETFSFFRNDETEEFEEADETDEAESIESDSTNEADDLNSENSDSDSDNASNSESEVALSDGAAVIEADFGINYDAGYEYDYQIDSVDESDQDRKDESDSNESASENESDQENSQVSLNNDDNATNDDKEPEAIEAEAIEPDINSEDTPEVAQALKKPFTVRVGSFSVQKNALNTEKTLRENKFIAYIKKTSLNGVVYYRVRVAGYNSRAEAEVARRKIVALGYPDADVSDHR